MGLIDKIKNKTNVCKKVNTRLKQPIDVLLIKYIIDYVSNNSITTLSKYAVKFDIIEALLPYIESEMLRYKNKKFHYSFKSKKNITKSDNSDYILYKKYVIGQDMCYPDKRRLWSRSVFNVRSRSTTGLYGSYRGDRLTPIRINNNRTYKIKNLEEYLNNSYGTDYFNENDKPYA